MAQARTTCPKCQRTSHHPMDVFFKWCSACEHNYSKVEYRNEDRSWLGEIWRDHPGWTLEEVADALHRLRIEIVG